MRRLFALPLLIGLVALGACNQGETMASGVRASRNYDVGDFSKIELAGPYEVRVKTGAKPGVTASGPRNVLDRLVVEVKGGELQIHPREGHFSFRDSPSSKVVIEVSAGALEGAAIAGSGDLSIDKVTGGDFKANIGGSGSLDLGTVEVAKLEVDIGGSGDVRASGKASSARYNVAGSGDIALGQVETKDLDVSIAGSGSVAARSTGKAKVTVLGSGGVDVSGGAKCETHKLGSGDIRCS